MTRRLPSIKRLAEDLRAFPTDRRHTVDDALGYLVAHRAELAHWTDVEDLAMDAYADVPHRGTRALVHHLEEVRRVVARELYARQLFVGGSVIDDLLFAAVCNTAVDDPLLATLEFLRDRRVNRPGLVLLPLHGFGLVATDIADVVSNRPEEVLRPKWDLAVTAQTNNINDTVAWLERARRALGVHKPASTELLHHYKRKSAGWLERNPLLAVRMVNVAGLTYENQRLLMGRVRAATGLLALAAAQQPEVADEWGGMLATTRRKNWATLDIRHYIVLSDHPEHRQHLESRMVPLNLDREDVLELTELGILLDPRARSRRPAAYARTEAAVAAVYSGWLNYSMGRDDLGARGRVHRKAFDSLAYFRRSFHRGGERWSSAIGLAVAFEMLLTDSYGHGVTDQIVRRTGLVLHGTQGRAEHQRAVRALFAERGNIVHRGDVGGLDLRPAQRAYAEIFSRLGTRFDEVEPDCAEPLRMLTGDAVVVERDDDVAVAA